MTEKSNLSKNLSTKRARESPESKIQLTKYGYSIKKSDAERRAALMAAIKDHSTISVLKKLDQLKNFQPIKENKDVISKDAEYLQKIYSTTKKFEEAQQHGETKPVKKRGRPRKISQAQTGGEKEGSDESDIVVANVELPEEQIIEINTVVDMEKVCTEGKCSVKNMVDELHSVNGKEIRFYTLREEDADDVLKLDKVYFDSNATKDDVLKKIRNNHGLLIGIKVDNMLQGYCFYNPLENKEIKFEWFCANKGYGTALYTFLERFFQQAGYERILLTVSLEGSYAIRRINFWYLMGFTVYEAMPEKKKLNMHKYI